MILKWLYLNAMTTKSHVQRLIVRAGARASDDPAMVRANTF